MHECDVIYGRPHYYVSKTSGSKMGSGDSLDVTLLVLTPTVVSSIEEANF